MALRDKVTQVQEEERQQAEMAIQAMVSNIYKDFLFTFSQIQLSKCN